MCIPGYNDSFIPAGVQLPKPLTALYDEKHRTMSKEEIVLKAHEVIASIKLSQLEVGTIVAYSARIIAQ